jgi:N-acetyl-1-D-myo-inositol-2-amino-2-deoxy-alpha-D-glucopyranoside deacetylase
MPTLLLVHAHPDDESITTGGTVLRATLRGHRVVLVTCTRGEEGEIHNLDPDAARPRLGEIRTRELERACAILGVDRLALLDYRDSGMAGAAANHHPASFHRAPLANAAAAIARIMDEERPDAVVTYTPDGTYGHPDHVKAHLATHRALDELRRRDGWAPDQVWWQAMPRTRIAALAARLGPALLPGTARMGVPDERIDATVDVAPVLARKREAVAAHHTQNPADPRAAQTGQVLEAMGRHEHFVRGQASCAPRSPSAPSGRSRVALYS